MMTVAAYLLSVGMALAQSDAEKAAVRGKLEVQFAAYTLPMTPPQLGELLNRVAWESPGWTLLGKPGGTNCPLPDGRLVSCDILLYRATLRGWDVITDAGGMQSSISGPTGEGEDLKPLIDSGARTIEAPVDPGGDPDPDPQPVPPYIKEILNRLNLIEQGLTLLGGVVGELTAVQDVHGKELAFQEKLILDIHQRVNNLVDYVGSHQIPTGCTVKVLGIPLACRLIVEP